MNIREIKKITRAIGDVEDRDRAARAMLQYESVVRDDNAGDAVKMSTRIGMLYLSKDGTDAMYLISGKDAGLKPGDLASLLDSIEKNFKADRRVSDRIIERIGNVLEIERKLLEHAGTLGYADYLNKYDLLARTDLDFSIRDLLGALVENPRIAALDDNGALYPLDVMFFALGVGVGGGREAPPPAHMPRIPELPREIPRRIPGRQFRGEPLPEEPSATLMVFIVGVAVPDGHPYRTTDTADLVERYKEELFSVFNMEALPYREAFSAFAAFGTGTGSVGLEGVAELVEDFFDTVVRWLIYRFGDLRFDLQEHGEFSAISLLREVWRLRSGPIPAHSLLKMALYVHATAMESGFSSWPKDRDVLVDAFETAVDEGIQEPLVSRMNELMAIVSTRPGERKRTGPPAQITKTPASTEDAVKFIWKATFEEYPGTLWEGAERVNKLEELQAFNLMIDADQRLDASVTDFIPTESIGDAFSVALRKGGDLEKAIEFLLKNLEEKIEAFSVMQTELYENVVLVMAIVESRNPDEWQRTHEAMMTELDSRIKIVAPVNVFASLAKNMSQDPRDLTIENRMRPYFDSLRLLSMYMSSILLHRQDVIQFGTLFFKVLSMLKGYIDRTDDDIRFELYDPGYERAMGALFRFTERKTLDYSPEVLQRSWSVFFSHESGILDAVYSGHENERPSMGAWLRDWFVKYVLIWYKYRTITSDRKAEWLDLYRNNLVAAFLSRTPEGNTLLDHVVPKTPRLTVETASAYRKLLYVPETEFSRTELLSLRGAVVETRKRIGSLAQKLVANSTVSEAAMKKGIRAVLGASSVIRYPLLDYMRMLSDPFDGARSDANTVALFDEMLSRWIPTGRDGSTDMPIGADVIGRMELFFRNTQESRRERKALSAPFQMQDSESILPMLIFSAGPVLQSDNKLDGIVIELYKIHAHAKDARHKMTVERFGIVIQALFFQEDNYGDLQKNQGYRRTDIDAHLFGELFDEDWSGKDWLKALYVDSLKIIDVETVLATISPVRTPTLAFLMIWCLYRGYIDERELPIRYKSQDQASLLKGLRERDGDRLFGISDRQLSEERFDSSSKVTALATSAMIDAPTMDIEYEDDNDDDIILETATGREDDGYMSDGEDDGVFENNNPTPDARASKRLRSIKIPDIDSLEAAMSSGNKQQAMGAIDSWDEVSDSVSTESAFCRLLEIKNRYGATLESWGDVRAKLDEIITDVSV